MFLRLPKIISYYAALVDNESSHDRAMRFIRFLSGEQATDVFYRYGFIGTHDA